MMLVRCSMGPGYYSTLATRIDTDRAGPVVDVIECGALYPIHRILCTLQFTYGLNPKLGIMLVRSSKPVAANDNTLIP